MTLSCVSHGRLSFSHLPPQYLHCHAFFIASTSLSSPPILLLSALHPFSTLNLPFPHSFVSPDLFVFSTRTTKKTVPPTIESTKMDFARRELVQRQQEQPVLNTTETPGATEPNIDAPLVGVSSTAVYGEYGGDGDLADGMVTPTRQSNSSIGSPSTSEDLDIHFCTPPPMPAFTHPPSPPRPGYSQALEHITRRFQPSQQPQSSAYPSREAHLYNNNGKTGQPLGSDNQLSDYTRWFRAQLPDSSATDGPLPDDMVPRKPLTSIAGSNRCLWPPDTTFLTMSPGGSTTVARGKPLSFSSSSLSFQNRNRDFNQQSTNGETTPSLSSSPLGGATSSTAKTTAMTSKKNHGWSDSFKDSGECSLDLQPRRKARRTMDGPYFKERNDRMVASYVQKLIQEAVEDGVGELDLRYVLSWAG